VIRASCRFGPALAVALGVACAGRLPGAPVPALPAAPAAAAASAAAVATGRAAAPTVRITILHFNDVYEVTPTGGGRWGGPARVAALRQVLQGRNPNTVTLLAGDFLSPSALSTARLDGERLDGRQMVAVLNELGLDLATFGNHEFDLRETAFFERLREARFGLLSVNVRGADGMPLPGVTPHRILTFPDGRGGVVRMAVFGVTMDRDRAAYVRIAEPLEAARAHARLLRDSAEIIVALTHLPLAQDIGLAEGSPEIDLVLGGHEHENLLIRRGDDLTPVAKTDANFHTVYVHELAWDVTRKRLAVESDLVAITDSLAEDPATLAVARRWVELAYRGFRDIGFEPEATVTRLAEPFDGRESVVYQQSTALTKAIADAMLEEADSAVAGLYNAGSIRIDDVLLPGPLTQYDVIRVLPFGGPVVEVEVTGALLRRVLEQGERNRGTGGFLQRVRIERTSGGWSIAGGALDDQTRYRLAVSDFLISGREQGMDFLTRDHPELRVVRTHRDIRLALIDLLRSRAGPAR
jgi:5'-nucleotidase